MRIGQNPAKFVKEVAKPERITVAVLNYIPFLSGYYTDLLEVLQTSLNSLREGAELPFDLLVFDNGSCPEVRQYLADEYEAGRIQYLILSDKNLGKGGAWNVIFGGAPGEIIVYADNDCLFYPGWLSHSLQLLETYPNVGMVTARPFRTKPELYTSTVVWAEKEPLAKVEHGQFIPFETFREFDLSLGQSEEEIRQHYDSSEDVRLEYQGVQAIVGGSHWQFMARKEVLLQFLPFTMDRPMGQVRQLDQHMNETGYLRLMPTQPFAMNLSNTLRNVANLPQGTQNSKPPASRSRLLDLPPVKKIFLSLYDAIFRWYYDRQ